MTISNSRRLLVVLAAIAVAAASVGAQLNEKPAETIITTTAVPITSSSSSSSSSTPRSTTTTTTTAKTTTTTTEVPLSTSSSTTTSTSTSTTTEVAPATTTTAPAPPAPIPAPPINNWSYGENNVTCLIVQMAAQLNVTYETTDAQKSAIAVINLPASNQTTTSGQCGNATDILHINWGSNSSLSLEFRHTVNDSSHYELSLVQLQLNVSHLPNAKPNQVLALYNIQPHFATHAERSYHCTRPQKLELAASPAENATSVASVLVSHLQLEAFHRGADAHFSTVQDCDAVDTPDIVPIAVGCALAALVALVLIAYLVGRRRRQTRGYLSM